MVDDRDFSWMGRTAPSPAAPVEHTLWALTKGVGRTEMRVRIHPHGHELRALLDRGTGQGLALLWSELFQPGRGRDMGAVSEDHRASWIERGWVDVSGIGA